jgi:ribosome-binding factor A
LQIELTDLIAGLKDPRLAGAGPVSINHVDVNRDISVATVYVSFIGADDRVTAAAIDALVGAGPRLRGPLARRLHLRRAPELRFVADSSVEFAARLSEIVAEDEARAPSASAVSRESQSMNAEMSVPGKAYRSQHSEPYAGEEQRSQGPRDQVNGLSIAGRSTEGEEE